MAVPESPVAESTTEATPGAPPPHAPYIADNASLPEMTFSAVLMGAILGIIFGASSLYLVLRVGMTVSASIPIAVLSITLFRALSKVFGTRKATILENNIVQTTGSAGESIAFGVGVTMPALMILGYDMDLVRVMLVASLGGLLGILMMIPLRRAFIVKQHGRLTYPEGTACAKVLIVGEEGGSSARTVFTGFGLAFVYQFLMKTFVLWQETVAKPIGAKFPGAVLSLEVNPALLGVGYIIGPRIAAITVAGGLLAAIVLTPSISFFGQTATNPIAPGTKLIGAMSPTDIRNSYTLYIGAGAVAAGGIISVFQALPMIVGSIAGSLRDMRRNRHDGTTSRAGRTDRDLPMLVVGIGALLLVVAIASTNLIPTELPGRIVGALMILGFGFLFVTVSSRLTGEIGSSSNPISGMTVATLLLTCMVFVLAGWKSEVYRLAALSIAGIVCIAASNGGTTSQDLKTGFLVGATPKNQQLSILVGALTSAIVIGFTLLLLNDVSTVYTKKAEYLPTALAPPDLTETETYEGTEYKVWRVTRPEAGTPVGRYLVDDSRHAVYLVDPAINGRVSQRDDGTKVEKYDAPKATLMALIIDGVMKGDLPWALVLIGASIGVVAQLAGIPALVFAVGVYLPLAISTPIFVGGCVRWLVDRATKTRAEDADSSPAVLLSSGYIAGGTIAGILAALVSLIPGAGQSLDLSRHLPASYNQSIWPAVVVFAALTLTLFLCGAGRILRSDDPAAAKRIQVREDVI